MEEEKQEERKKPEPVPVRIVGEKGESALVEWVQDGSYKRAYVPAKSVKEGAVSPITLGKGIPYGLPWEDFIEITATPESVANELRRRGVWYLEDLHHSAILHANQAFSFGAFVNKAKRAGGKK